VGWEGQKIVTGGREAVRGDSEKNAGPIFGKPTREETRRKEQTWFPRRVLEKKPFEQGGRRGPGNFLRPRWGGRGGETKCESGGIAFTTLGLDRGGNRGGKNKAPTGKKDVVSKKV